MPPLIKSRILGYRFLQNAIHVKVSQPEPIPLFLLPVGNSRLATIVMAGRRECSCSFRKFYFTEKFVSPNPVGLRGSVPRALKIVAAERRRHLKPSNNPYSSSKLAAFCLVLEKKSAAADRIHRRTEMEMALGVVSVSSVTKVAERALVA